VCELRPKHVTVESKRDENFGRPDSSDQGSPIHHLCFELRPAKSPWSKINRARAEALIASGAMKQPGFDEVARARADGRWARAYEGSRTAEVPADLATALARNPRERAFFDALDRANRYAILWRVQTAKKPETRARRIEQFVALCAAGKTLHPTREKKRRE
jgi:uncharacterized protein YdeI (YjbR/CyaY-like superfamily)